MRAMGAAAALLAAALPAAAPVTVSVRSGKVRLSDGRFDAADAAAPRQDYPGGSATVRFSGSSYAAVLVNASRVVMNTTDGTTDYPGTPRQAECTFHGSKSEQSLAATSGPPLAVIIDGSFAAYTDVESCEIVTVDGRMQGVPRRNNSIIVAEGLDPSTEHVVTVMKNFETGVATVHGFELATGAAVLDPPPPPARRMLCVGDSITCGYGVGPDCRPNHYRTWCRNAARTVGAEAQAVCKSGAGIYAHTPPFRDDLLIHQAVWEDPAVTSPARDWVPDVVVFNIGSNDVGFSRRDMAGWRSNYTAMLRGVRAAYPSAPFLIGQGPFNGGVADLAGFVAGFNATGGNARYVAFEQAVAGCPTYENCGDPTGTNSSGPSKYPTGYGCFGHPGWGTQERMGAVVADALRDALGW